MLMFVWGSFLPFICDIDEPNAPLFHMYNEDANPKFN